MRTPENLELTNPQEFGSSWAAVEVKPPLTGSLPHPDGPRPALREAGPGQGRGTLVGGCSCNCNCSLRLRAGISSPGLSYDPRTHTIPSHKSGCTPALDQALRGGQGLGRRQNRCLRRGDHLARRRGLLNRDHLTHFCAPSSPGAWH